MFNFNITKYKCICCLLFIVTQATPPPLVLSPARLIEFEKHTSTRANGQYKINVANILMHGKLKKRAEFFASSESKVVSILIAFLSDRDEKEDLNILMNATWGHRVARESLNFTDTNTRGHHLYAHAEKACSDFKTAHLNESAFHTFVEPDQHSLSKASYLFQEEEQYSLKRCLSVRGISVHRIMSPEEKMDQRERSPGSLSYRRMKGEPVSFIECAGRTSAYSAAW